MNGEKLQIQYTVQSLLIQYTGILVFSTGQFIFTIRSIASSPG
jgi:hypothetical protein